MLGRVAFNENREEVNKDFGNPYDTHVFYKFAADRVHGGNAYEERCAIGARVYYRSFRTSLCDGSLSLAEYTEIDRLYADCSVPYR